MERTAIGPTIILILMIAASVPFYTGLLISGWAWRLWKAALTRSVYSDLAGFLVIGRHPAN